MEVKEVLIFVIRRARQLQVQSFPNTYQRRRSARKGRTDFGTEESLGKYFTPSLVVSRECFGYTPNKNRGDSAMTLNEVKNIPDEATEAFSFVPRGRRSKRTRPDHVTGKKCLHPATSAAYPCSISRKKVRKRKSKPKNDSSDSEVYVTQRFRVRGHVRRGKSITHATTGERGKLDSAELQHYLTHIWSAFPAEKVKNITYFDSLWFNLYSNEKTSAMVLNWIKEKDVFSKAYVLVPIILWSHWSLLIFCHLGDSTDLKTATPCMLLLDSMHTIGPTRLEPLIRRLLLDMYENEGRPETKSQLKKLPLLIPKVPQQKRGEECGYYVLNYINLFLESAPEKFSKFDGYPYFMKQDWFTVDEMESFYRRLDAFPKVFNDHDEDDDDPASVSFLGAYTSAKSAEVIDLL